MNTEPEETTVGASDSSDLLGANYFRLNPYLNVLGCKHSIFDIADAAGETLICGNCWGDDYLPVPPANEDKAALIEMMKEAGVFFEPVNLLPPHLRRYA